MATTAPKERQFARFAVAGGAAAAVNWIAGRLLEPTLGLGVAVVVAYLIGMTTAFFLNKAFVFKKSGRRAEEEFARFALVNGVSVAIVWGVTMLLARVVLPAIGFGWHAEAIAHAIGIGAPILPSFFLHRAFSFAQTRAADGDAA